MDHQELGRLVERAQNGDVEAFAQIYSEVSKSLYYYALRMTKNEHDAKDIVQETMIEVYKHLGELKNPGALKAYVNSVAYHRSINLLNKQKRQQSDDIDEMYDLTDEDEEFLPEEYAESQERREYVISLVDSLPDAQRTVIMLYYYKQMPSKEIAELLGIEDGAVRARLNRARNTLKQRIQADSSNHGSGRGAAFLMAVPVLTHIFDLGANSAFVTSIGHAIWQSVGVQLGLSAAAIGASSAIATAGTSGFASSAAATTAVAAAATTSVISGVAAAVGVGLVSTAAIAGVVFARQKPPEVPQEPISAYVQEVEVYAAPLPATVEIEQAPEEAPKAEIHVTTDTLRYPAGTAPSIEQIRKDAGVTACDAQGDPVEAEALGYENIDFFVPDDYYITFEIDGADQEAIWKAVIILVE